MQAYEKQYLATLIGLPHAGHSQVSTQSDDTRENITTYSKLGAYGSDDTDLWPRRVAVGRAYEY